MRTAVLFSLIIVLAACAGPPSVTIPEPLGPAAKRWYAIKVAPQMVEYLRGTFDTLNFTVEETGERFYLVYRGDGLSVKGGKAGQADLDVPITEAQVNAVAELASDGSLDRQDAFQVMQILYAPITRSFLTGSFLNNDIIRRLAGVEDLIHITLWTPERPESRSVTLKAEGGHWYVLDGLVGDPKRVFRLNEPQTLEYMRQVHRARSSSSLKAWIDFVNWYTKWKDRVSIVPAKEPSPPNKASAAW